MFSSCHHLINLTLMEARVTQTRGESNQLINKILTQKKKRYNLKGDARRHSIIIIRMIKDLHNNNNTLLFVIQLHTSGTSQEWRVCLKIQLKKYLTTTTMPLQKFIIKRKRSVSVSSSFCTFLSRLDFGLFYMTWHWGIIN